MAKLLQLLEKAAPTLLSVAVSVCLVLWLDSRRPAPDQPAPAPVPVSSLTEALRPAWSADQSPTKKKDKADLAALLSDAAPRLSDDPSLATAGDLVRVLHDSADWMIEGRLAGVREAAAAYLDKEMGTKQNTPLDKPLRDKYKAQFAAYSRALGELK